MTPSTARRPDRSAGFVTIAIMGVMLTLMLLTAAAFAAADGDLHLSRNDQDQKRAYAAAEAGIADYFFHLSQDQSYWTKCDGVTDPAVQQQGPLTHWRNIFGSSEQYAIELLPANGATSCVQSKAEATMIDKKSGTFSIRATGNSNGVHRSIVATFRRTSFLDFLYFTDLETLDPATFALDTNNNKTTSSNPAPCGPDLLSWGSCPTKDRGCLMYRADGRSSAGNTFNGQIYINGKWQSFSDGCTEINFVTGDTVAGPLHTNDSMLICGKPVFGRTSDDRIEVSHDPGWVGNGTCSGNGPNFVGDYDPPQPNLTLPPTNTSLRSIAQPAYRFSGTVHIALSGTTMTVTDSSGKTTSMPFPPNGVVYVDNGNCGESYDILDPYGDAPGCADVYVHGTYSQDLTIASAKDIIVDGNISRSGDTMLGLIADGFVRVYHPVKNFTPVLQRNGTYDYSCQDATGTIKNLSIDAAILSLKHSFIVDYYFCGSQLGTLTVNGTIGQKFRGPVGQIGSSGYLKNYTYDDRLKYRSPPYFLDPVQASWRILRYREQVPPAQ